MSIEESLYTYITASSFASGVDLRYGTAKQSDTPPYIIVERLATDYPVYLGGGTTKQRTTMSLDCYAKTGSSVNGIADVLYDRLHGKRGTVGADVFDEIILDNRFSDFIPEADGSDDGTHVAGMTLTAWHKVAAPAL